MEQLGFEGMPRRLYSCTPTRLATWLDCPRRYRMTYIDRPTPDVDWSAGHVRRIVEPSFPTQTFLPQSAFSDEVRTRFARLQAKAEPGVENRGGHSAARRGPTHRECKSPEAELLPVETSLS